MTCTGWLAAIAFEAIDCGPDRYADEQTDQNGWQSDINQKPLVTIRGWSAVAERVDDNQEKKERSTDFPPGVPPPS
jgi:hypothetical protein